MERFVAPMATWEIGGGDLPPVRVLTKLTSGLCKIVGEMPE